MNKILVFSALLLAGCGQRGDQFIGSFPGNQWSEGVDRVTGNPISLGPIPTTIEITRNYDGDLIINGGCEIYLSPRTETTFDIVPLVCMSGDTTTQIVDGSGTLDGSQLTIIWSVAVLPADFSYHFNGVNRFSGVRRD